MRALLFAALFSAFAATDSFAQKAPAAKAAPAKKTTAKKTSNVGAVATPVEKDAEAAAIKSAAKELAGESAEARERAAVLATELRRLMLDAESEFAGARFGAGGGIEDHEYWDDYKGCMYAACGGSALMTDCFDDSRLRMAVEYCEESFDDSADAAAAAHFIKNVFLLESRKHICKARKGMWDSTATKERPQGGCKITITYKREAKKVSGGYGVDVPENGCDDNKSKVFWLGDRPMTCLPMAFGAKEKCFRVDPDVVADMKKGVKTEALLGGIGAAGGAALTVVGATGDNKTQIWGGAITGATALSTTVVKHTVAPSKAPSRPEHGYCYVDGIPHSENTTIRFDWVEQEVSYY